MKKKIVIGCLLLAGAAPGIGFGAYGDIPCSDCHSASFCSPPSAACGSCHAVPPATGAHLAHFGGTIDQAQYGDLRVTADFAAQSDVNIIGCGNCHPMDQNLHGNETWGDVELYNPAAPVGTLKSRNVTATYDPATKTCSNVYCHSANSWTTDGTVPQPWPAGVLPDNIVTQRVYQSPVWDSGAPLGCNGCHENPPTTSYPDNDAGAGDSHYWIDPYGYENLHVWNMGFAPAGCRTCHYETVQDESTWGVDPATARRYYDDVAIHNKAKHVNGTVDVAFDTVNGFTFNTSQGPSFYDLLTATYDPATKTCTNVSCHGGGDLQETSVIWGTPYRWYVTEECNRCHAY